MWSGASFEILACSLPGIRVQKKTYLVNLSKFQWWAWFDWREDGNANKTEVWVHWVTLILGWLSCYSVWKLRFLFIWLLLHFGWMVLGFFFSFFFVIVLFCFLGFVGGGGVVVWFVGFFLSKFRLPLLSLWLWAFSFLVRKHQSAMTWKFLIFSWHAWEFTGFCHTGHVAGHHFLSWTWWHVAAHSENKSSVKSPLINTHLAPNAKIMAYHYLPLGNCCSGPLSLVCGHWNFFRSGYKATWLCAVLGNRCAST